MSASVVVGHFARPVVKGGHRGTVPPQTLVVPPATVYLNYYETRLCGRDVLVPI